MSRWIMCSSRVLDVRCYKCVCLCRVVTMKRRRTEITFSIFFLLLILSSCCYFYGRVLSFEKRRETFGVSLLCVFVLPEPIFCVLVDKMIPMSLLILKNQSMLLLKRAPFLNYLVFHIVELKSFTAELITINLDKRQGTVQMSRHILQRRKVVSKF